MTGDDREEFVRVVEEGLLELAQESTAPPADLSARIRDRVTRRRRRSALRLSVVALACVAAAIPISWSAAGGSSKAAAGGTSKTAAGAVAQASPTPAVSSPETPSWWPLTDNRFAQIRPTPALTDLWDTRTGTHHTDVRALETIQYRDKSLIVLAGHGDDGRPRIGLMAALVLPDGTVSDKTAEFFAEQTVTSPSAPIAIATYPLANSQAKSSLTIIAPPCPDQWRITTEQAGGDDADAAFREDAHGDLILTKMLPPQSLVTTRCGTQAFLFSPERASAATSTPIQFELLTQR